MKTMITHYYYQPQAPKTDLNDDGAHSRPHKSHRLVKVLFAALLVILATLILVAGLSYWYIQNAPLSNQNGRTNILVLGVDEAAKLSDTIMLISIDQTGSSEPQIAMLSIPRDLYLSIPGFGFSKINAAHAFGENYDYNGGGAALTSATIEEHFSQPIHYYLSLDFKGFTEIIDSIGGVDIEVEQELYDPQYPTADYSGFEPLFIEAGRQHMDGDTALRYSRSRYSTSDFDRAYRQQQVLVALRDELSSRDNLYNLSTLRSLMSVFDSSVSTNLSRLELARLAMTIHEVDDFSPQRYVLDNSNLLISTQTETGSSLVPRSGNFDEIQQFVANIFNQSVVEEFKQQ